MTKIFSILFAGMLTQQSVVSADWPQWRGPHRDGISTETGLLTEWPEGGPPLVWKAGNLGGGYTTPSIAGGKIYGMGYRGDQEVVWVLDVKDGSEIWSTVVGPAYREVGYAEGPRATPTVDGDRIYTLGAAGNVTCLDAKTGKILWEKNYPKDFGGEMMSGWGFSESLLVDGGHLICTPGGKQGTVAALDKMTGERLWQSRDLTDQAAYASLLKVEIEGVPQYIVFTAEHVAGIAPADGTVLWQAERKGKTAVIPTPVCKDNYVWVTSGYNVGCNLFKVTRSGSQFSAEEVYSNRDIKNHHGGAILLGDYVYASSGPVIVCMNFLTGEVAWEERSVGKGSLGYADGHLYLRSEKGPIALIKATPKAYSEKSRFDQPDRSDKNAWPHPIISDGRLYLRDQDILLSYDVTRK